MLGSLKKLLATSPNDAADLRDVSDWAESQGWRFKRAREGAGFVVDGAFDRQPWRLEWGPPQRDFIGAQELRMRIELGLPADLQMLLMSRPLMEQLDQRTYEQSIEGTQTRIDSTTPEEVRWLVLFRPVDLMPFPAVRAHFGAVASLPEAGFSWIEGALAQALERASGGFLRLDPPFLLMTHRGKAYLRLAAPEVDSVLLKAVVALFGVAVGQALRAAQGRAGGREWPSSGSTAWQSLHGEDSR
jgi:hypothetical protein